jgi:hypothetical protein
LADSAFWRNLGGKFRALDPGRTMCANWKYISATQIMGWDIAGINPVEDRNQFIRLAKIGGAQLDSDAEPERTWLNKLRETIPSRAEHRTFLTSSDGEEQFIDHGTITDVCHASANLCDELELHAQLEERNAERDQKISDDITREHRKIIDSMRSAQPWQAKPDEAPRKAQRLPQPILIAPAVAFKTKDERRSERESIRDAYFSTTGEKIVLLDVCWAVKQRYREWLRWISGELKDGSKADMAFKTILTSGTRPEHYRVEPRPNNWK